MRGWLGSALVFVLLPGLIAALILQYRVAERRLDADLNDDLALARSAGGTFQSYVHGLLRQELAIGLAVPTQLDRSPADADAYLAASANDSPAIRAFGWIDPTGRVVAASSPGAVGASVADRPYFQEIADGADWSIGALSPDPTGTPATRGRRSAIVVARALRDGNTLRGIVLAVVEPERLGEVVGLAPAEGGMVGIVDAHGWLLYERADGVSSPPAPTWGIPEIAARDGTAESAGFDTPPWQPGATAVAVSPLPELGWAAVVARPASSVWLPILRDALQNLVLLGGLWCCALVAALVTARRVTRPIRALRAQVTMLGDGDLTARAAVAGPVEVRDLAASFNAMAEHLERHERAREDYLHAISHDLRSPLTAVLANAQLLRRMQADREAPAGERRCAEAVEASAQRMGSMIRDLVDAARLEGGELQLERAHVDLAALVGSWLARTGDERIRARVTLEPAPDLPPADADPERVERVVANLISNALKYSPDDAPVLVSIRREADELLVTVRDRGVGIAPEELGHLFQRYGRTRAGRGRADSLGLGLFIVKQIVEAHGGRVWVDSTPGEGSTFGISLPIAVPPAALAAA